MNILMIHHYGGIGGGTISCLDVAKMLVEKKHQVNLLVPMPCKELINSCKKNKINLISCMENPVILNYHNANNGVIKTWIRYIKSNKNKEYWHDILNRISPDIIIFNSLVQVPMVNIFRDKHIKIICFIRETIRGKSNDLTNRVLKRYLNQCDAVVFLTQFDKESWKLNNKIKQYIIPDIVDDERFKIQYKLNQKEISRLNIPKANNCILYLGGISYEKGILELLKALNRFEKNSQNITLIILGNKENLSLRYNLFQKIIHHKLNNYVVNCKKFINEIIEKGIQVLILGEVDDVSMYYSISDFVVFPVKKVHQARPVYEAGYFHKPIIIPDFNNFNECVHDGYNGKLYRVNDYLELNKAIKKFIDDYNYKEILGNNNYEMYSKFHTYEVAKLLLIDMIEKINKY